MHAFIKISFYVVFIILSLFIGFKMVSKKSGKKHIMIFGIMTLLLGIGESFHLIPRILDILNIGSKNYEPFISNGRFIASVSIVFVYLLLYWFLKMYYHLTFTKKIDFSYIVLSLISIISSVLLLGTENTFMILLRNIPTFVLGMFVIYHFKTQQDKKSLTYLWLALLLALVFTISFELLHISYPFFIILMMPKTLMYIWVIIIGYTGLNKT